MPTYRSRALRLHYESVGEGPTVLLLHGQCSFCFAWAPQLDTVVGAGWRAVLPDFAGHWLSDPVTEPTTVADLATDIVNLLDHLGIASAAVCGLSIGGTVALQLLVDHPDRVIGAMVGAAMVGGGHLLAFNDRVAWLNALWPVLTTEAYRNAVAGRAYFEGWRKVLTTVDDRAPHLEAEVPLAGDDIQADLAQVLHPVVVVAGENDRMFPLGAARGLADLIPRARYEVLAGAGHVSNRERPDLFNPLLAGFLAELGPRTGP